MIRTKRQPATWKVLFLPDGDRIILASEYESDSAALDLYDAKHNIYRLDASGNIIWQVQRDDSNHPADWWEILHRYASAEGRDGARVPFLYFELKYPDGSTNISPVTGDPPNEAIWTPDCTIRLSGSAYQQYILDTETGIAKNVTDWPVRPW